MENVSGAYNSAVTGASNLVSTISGVLATWQILLIAAILLVLVIILICVLSSRNRRLDDMAEDQERALRERAENERRQEKMLREAEEKLLGVKRDAADAIAAKQSEMDKLGARANDLQSFHDQYASIPDAQAEANRILREARDHAYLVSNRTEQEYAEIIEHANREAEAIRNLANQRLVRSHDALKQALKRANEIVEEARAEAGRLAQIEFVPSSGLLDSPKEQPAAVPAEPASEAEPAEGEAETPN